MKRLPIGCRLSYEPATHKNDKEIMKMKNELLEKLEKELFYLEMKDGWTADDFEKSRKLKEEIRKLENENN
jgi:hypothetical protein